MKASLCVAVLALSLVPLASPAASSTVQRCEAKDGKVTYSNTQCPEGTTPVRKVNTEPPVSVDEKKAAEERARKDAAAAKQAERDRTQQEAREKKQADERARADVKANARCERARHDLERAKTTRADLGARAATVEKMQKADSEISRREAEVAKECPR